MRKRFEQQRELGLKRIEETGLLLTGRDATPALIKSLVTIFKTPQYHEPILTLIEERLSKGKKNTGRRGLDYWQLFVLSSFRMGLNLSYDRLADMVGADTHFRQLLGIETESYFPRKTIRYQRIIDNLQLIGDDLLKKINTIIVGFGHDVFKKKGTAALFVKTDSFVVLSNVHFPTDYNLLWDSSRKALEVVRDLKEKHCQIGGWRKWNDWFKSLKNWSRAIGQIAARGGKNKEVALTKATAAYLEKGNLLLLKLKESKKSFPLNDVEDLSLHLNLEVFMDLMEKHLDLLERRILKEEKIPHSEKLFSIFEQYTEWIVKGKRNPSVELGKKVSITTDQYGLLLDHYIMENEADSEIVIATADRLLPLYSIASWSFDKGYWHWENKELLSTAVPFVVMPKKGKRNKEETVLEKSSLFKKRRNKHSAIESNINELENRGLDKCPDKGFRGFKRYVAAGIVAYNLHKIGKELIRLEVATAEKKAKRKSYKMAA